MKVMVQTTIHKDKSWIKDKDNVKKILLSKHVSFDSYRL